MKWSEKLSIGLPEIDEQHKQLLACIDRLEAVTDHESRRLAVYFAMDALEDYARIHFSVEEILMRLLEYPQREAHARAHREFIEEVERLKREELAVDSHLRIAAFLRGWWGRHIQTLDRDYADYFLGKPWQGKPR